MARHCVDAYQIVQLNCGNSFVDTRYDLLGDGGGIDMIWVQAIAQTGNACCDLVELDSLFAVVCSIGISAACLLAHE